MNENQIGNYIIQSVMRLYINKDLLIQHRLQKVIIVR